MAKAINILVIFHVFNLVLGSYYANKYPYNVGIDEHLINSESSTDSHAAAGSNALLNSKQHDQGNSLYAGQDGTDFYNKENLSKGHDIKHLKSGASVDDRQHVIGQNVETDKSHNRKHIKSGFHNTYNKDESGSNSSYYEDSDDHGGKLAYDKSHGVSGDAQDSKYHENLHDGQMRDRLDDRYGGFNRRGSQDRQHYYDQDQGNRQGYYDKYDRGQVDRMNIYNERPTHMNNNHYYRPEINLVDHRRPIDYPYPVNSGGYINGHSTHHRLPSPPITAVSPINHLPPPMPLNRLPPPPPLSQLQQQDDGGYFPRHRITIYDDPRELLDPRRAEAERRKGVASTSSSSSLYMERNHGGGGGGGGVDGIYHSPRLEFRPSPLRLRDYYDDNKRDNLRYRDRNY